MEDDSDDPEERRKRMEAQQTADTIGVAAGVLIGLAAQQNQGDFSMEDEEITMGGI